MITLPEQNKFERIFKIFDVLAEISEYKPEVTEDLTGLTSQDFIDKWQSTYDRVMKLKAFL